MGRSPTVSAAPISVSTAATTEARSRSRSLGVSTNGAVVGRVDLRRGEVAVDLPRRRRSRSSSTPPPRRSPAAQIYAADAVAGRSRRSRNSRGRRRRNRPLAPVRPAGTTVSPASGVGVTPRDHRRTATTRETAARRRRSTYRERQFTLRVAQTLLDSSRTRRRSSPSQASDQSPRLTLSRHELFQ